MGLSVNQCRADYFTYYKKPTETWQDTTRNIEFYVNSMVYGCETRHDITSMFALYKLLSLCPPDCLTFVQLQNPGSTIEAVNQISEFSKRQNKTRSHYQNRPWMRGGEKYMLVVELGRMRTRKCQVPHQYQVPHQQKIQTLPMVRIE